MLRIDELGNSPRKSGMLGQFKELKALLVPLYEGADQVFQLQRETDSGYDDPRTDYLLGKREGILYIIQKLQREIDGLES